MGITGSIILGVVSGLLTGFFISALGQGFKKVILPWYQALVYDGVTIEGTWYLESIEPDHRRKVTLELSQKAKDLKGISTHILKDENDIGDNIRTYHIEGKIKDRFVTLTGKAVDPKRIGAFILLLEIISDGQQMKGYCAGYSAAASEVKGSRCILARLPKV